MANSPGDRHVEALMATLLGEGVAALRAHAAAMQRVAKRNDPEIVHEARVAVRRMRAALRVFRHPLERSGGKQRGEAAQRALKALGRVLGEARDWDVIRAELLPARRATLEKAIGKGPVTHLLRKTLGAQMHANAAARRFVAGEGFETDLLAIDRLRIALETGSPGSGGKDAVDALKRQRDRVRRKASGLRKLDAGHRHTLRIEGKRLRYAVELCKPLFKRRGRKWLHALKRLQDALGAVTDAHMLTERIRALDPAAGRALETDEHEYVRRQIPQIANLLEGWRKADAPWKASRS